MKKKFKIAFDIDGVVLDFTECFLKTAKFEFGILKETKFSDITRYEYSECLDISNDTVFYIVDYILNNSSKYKISPVNGAVEVLTKISKHIPLVFVTARHGYSIEQTKESLHSILPGVDKSKIKIIHCKGSEKISVLKKLNINHFIDDRTRNCRILKENGINVFLFDRPWNKTTETFNHVKSWDDIWDLLKKQYKNI